MAGDETLAGRYELGVVVGRGGMADVHQARDLLLGRDVAVKVLRDPAGDPTDRARFTSEARMLAGLSHPGLVTVLDAGIDQDRPFLVLELVDGPTLGRVIAAGPVAPERVARIGAQLAAALSFVHARGVVHRDVKPGNVLVGRGDAVKLADFGIARLIGDTVRHTSTGHTIGTAAYLAPEQVLGGEVTRGADVYALGLVLLEALTGERAFPGTPTEAALARVSASPAIPVSLAPEWRRLLFAMTARESSERPSAAQVAAELSIRPAAGPARGGAASYADRTVAMAPPTRRATPSVPIVVAPRRPGGRRGRVLAAVALAVLLAGGLTVVVAVRGSGAAPPAGTPAGEPSVVVGSTSPTQPGRAVSPSPVAATGTPSPVPSRTPVPKQSNAGGTAHGKAGGKAHGKAPGKAHGKPGGKPSGKPGGKARKPKPTKRHGTIER